MRRVTDFPGNIRVIFQNFQNNACCEKHLKDNERCLHLTQKYSWIFVLGHYICSSKFKVFPQLRSRKTVRFQKQIMSVDKYRSIFSGRAKWRLYSMFMYAVNNLDTRLVLIKTVGGPCVRNTACVLQLHTGKLWQIYEQAQFC